MITIGVTGASGLIGTALCEALARDGVRTIRFGRRAGAGDALWDPRSGTVDLDTLRRTDAVVHLAGAGIADRRWTDAYRAELLQSRVEGTGTISRALATLDDRPRVLVSASAVGFYGDTGENAVAEGAPRGDGFLADVVEAWENAADPARAAGLRVVHPRFGVVLSARGGALGKMLPAFRLGGGGPLGNGRQWMSWIALPDAVDAIRFALASDLRGPLNVVAPEPVRNDEFTATLASVLHRPALLRVPAFALRAAFGAMADETLLASSRVVPAGLQRAGFPWRHPALRDALTDALTATGP